MLLRDDRQVALNDVEVRCLEAADHYASAAKRTNDPELAQLFNVLSEERRRQAGELAAHILALDDLPKSPDPDSEDAHELISSIKSFFSGDQTATLISEREHGEELLAEAIGTARECDLPPGTQAFLAELATSVASARERLEAHRQA